MLTHRAWAVLVLGTFLSLAGGATSAHADLLATFEDVATDTAYGGTGGGSYWNGSDLSGGFTTGGLSFVNNYDTTFDFWSGWAFTNTTDTTTPGFGNQYSAAAGGGAEGSAQYGVFFEPFTLSATLSVAGGGTALLDGGYLTNTTYAHLSMRDGDAFAKKFGGATGDDPDWFLLTITGTDSQGGSTGSVDFYLADFRFANNSQDYILTDWTFVDLSSLGEVAGLQFDLSSSDVGQFGMNTPAYFALDNLSGMSAVPEPSTMALWGLGSISIFAGRRARRKRKGNAA